MQKYGPTFARLYNAKCSGFAKQVAPLILNFYAATSIGQHNKSVLDLCCGPGHLAAHFLREGYRIVGIDRSEHMLAHAKENARQYVESGLARFVCGDASDFTLDERFGLVVSTSDSLNHFEDERMLKKCFQCVRAISNGFLIFDLNTRTGLRAWNSIQVEDSSEDALIIRRGIFDRDGDRAWMRLTGLVRVTDRLYERFDETVFNSAFDMKRVKDILLEVGWKEIHFARIEDLRNPLTLADAEKEGRVFIVAGS